MSNLSDLVGGADLFKGSKYSYTYDRFNNSNSAIYFNKGYLQVPPGNYFSGDFTFTAWIFLKSLINNARIFDFGNGASSDNVVLFIPTSSEFGKLRSIFFLSPSNSAITSSLI